MSERLSRLGPGLGEVGELGEVGANDIQTSKTASYLTHCPRFRPPHFRPPNRLWVVWALSREVLWGGLDA